MAAVVRLETAIVKLGSSFGTNQRSIAYDGRGNTASETRPSGVGVTASYDAYARLTSYVRTGDLTQANLYNGLDDRVQVTSTDATTGVVADTRRYVFDGDGRLLGDYGASATAVKGEFVWLLPEAANDNVYGGDDGIGGYALLADRHERMCPHGGGRCPPRLHNCCKTARRRSICPSDIRTAVRETVGVRSDAIIITGPMYLLETLALSGAEHEGPRCGHCLHKDLS